MPMISVRSSESRYGPQRSVRDSQDRQPNPDWQPARDVDDKLGQEVPADPLSRIVHCFGRSVQIVPSREPQQPVPKILPFEQDQNHKDHDQPASR